MYFKGIGVDKDSSQGYHWEEEAELNELFEYLW
jgi:hypothetical protein